MPLRGGTHPPSPLLPLPIQSLHPPYWFFLRGKKEQLKVGLHQLPR